jgi:hypothetical protein
MRLKTFVIKQRRYFIGCNASHFNNPATLAESLALKKIFYFSAL